MKWGGVRRKKKSMGFKGVLGRERGESGWQNRNMKEKTTRPCDAKCQGGGETVEGCPKKGKKKKNGWWT